MKTKKKSTNQALKNNSKKTGKSITSFEEHLNKRYGKNGSKKRTEFEIKAKAFAIGEIIKEERRLSKMTQEQLAEKTGTRKSFISRIENGHSDIQLSTLYRLFETGLGKKVILTIQ
ncbi:MAG: helix-turn-helix domain-containing protein [Sediminibacterium sp.]